MAKGPLGMQIGTAYLYPQELYVAIHLLLQSQLPDSFWLHPKDIPNLDGFVDLLCHMRSNRTYNIPWIVTGAEVNIKGKIYGIDFDQEEIVRHGTVWSIKELFVKAYPEITIEEIETKYLSFLLDTSQSFIAALKTNIHEYLKGFVDDQYVKANDLSFEAQLKNVTEIINERLQLQSRNNLVISHDLLTTHSQGLEYHFLEMMLILWQTGIIQITNARYKNLNDDVNYQVQFKLTNQNGLSLPQIRSYYGLNLDTPQQTFSQAQSCIFYDKECVLELRDEQGFPTGVTFHKKKSSNPLECIPILKTLLSLWSVENQGKYTYQQIFDGYKKYAGINGYRTQNEVFRKYLKDRITDINDRLSHNPEVNKSVHITSNGKGWTLKFASPVSFVQVK